MADVQAITASTRVGIERMVKDNNCGGIMKQQIFTLISVRDIRCGKGKNKMPELFISGLTYERPQKGKQPRFEYLKKTFVSIDYVMSEFLHLISPSYHDAAHVPRRNTHGGHGSHSTMRVRISASGVLSLSGVCFVCLSKRADRRLGRCSLSFGGKGKIFIT